MSDGFDQVAMDYSHYRKVVRPANPEFVGAAVLKWHLIFPESLPIPPDQEEDARRYIRSEIAAGRFAPAHDAGFVVLHRTAEYLILYACVWRNNNELWEALHHKHLPAGGGFAPFVRERVTPTFCVWVLGVVAHEHRAWTRYLYSPRDAAARAAWLADAMTGWID